MHLPSENVDVFSRRDCTLESTTTVLLYIRAQLNRLPALYPSVCLSLSTNFVVISPTQVPPSPSTLTRGIELYT